MKQIATAVAILATSAFAYDDSIKECWDVRLRDESFFCYGEVGWPLSKNVYYDQVKRDDGKFFLKVYFLEARALYNIVKDKWKGEKYLEQPDNDCLAIARYFYCAVAFPRCKDASN